MDPFEWRIKMHCRMCDADLYLVRDDMHEHFNECLKLHPDMESDRDINCEQLTQLWSQQFNRHAQYENSKNNQ